MDSNEVEVARGSIVTKYNLRNGYIKCQLFNAAAQGHNSNT